MTRRLNGIFALVLMAMVVFACESGEKEKMKTTTRAVSSPPIPSPIKHEPYVIEDSSRLQELEGGVLLYVAEEGKGPYPTLKNNLIAHYHGMLPDGTVFDSSFDRGSTADLKLSQVVKGWQVALTRVRVGSKVKIIIPPEMGYGTQALPGIPANSTLVFDVQLVSMY